MAISVGRADWRNSPHLWILRAKYMEEEWKRDETLRPDSEETVVRISNATQNWLLDSNFIVLMAYDHETPVGYMVLGSGDFVGYKHSPGIRIDGLYVLPEYRHGAAGLQLLRKATEFVRINKYPRTQAIVMEGNATMRSQLERAGYRIKAVVYERIEVSNGIDDIGTKASQEVHATSGVSASVGQGRHADEPVVPRGARTCETVPSEPAIF